MTTSAAATAPLLLLPGLLCDRTVWEPQVRHFAAHDPIVANYGLSASLQDMARIALAAAPPIFALVGHSMGARVALEILRMAPERVARLALLDTGVHPPQPGEAEKRHALLDLARREGMESMVGVWLPPMVHPERHSDEALMAPLHRMATALGADVFEAQITALLGRPDAEPMLTHIAVPTLVGVGRQDGWSPPAQHQAMASRIAGAVLAVFEDCGHMAPVEAPDQVNAALEAWLAQT
jgi:pimeloyl-ACP methyl ester carboxylesterase